MEPLGNRNLAIDGLRGISILLVISFHFFGIRSEALPFESISIFRFGYLGVDLFFIISGFAISLTIASSDTATQFLLRRMIRLWPALLLTSVLIYALLNLSGSEPAPQI
jgi:peptidoglycan/LPS O-acetylase OafA/YrhL